MAERTLLKDNTVPDAGLTVEIDPKVYNDIARCAKLLSVQMIESSFSISPSFFDSECKKRPHIDFTEVHASYDADKKVITCIFQLDSYIKSGKRKLFNVRDKFAVFYGVAVDCDEAHAVAFAKKTGLIACYPYFRSHVASTASLANADVPILPTISAMPVQGKVKEKD